jgi:hypothetical protein
MRDVNRRDAIKFVAAGAALAAASPAARAQDDKKEPAGDRGVVYGNRLRWRWRHGHWWVVLDYDARFPHHWDPRRKCGDSGEHWIRDDAYKSGDIGGYCTQLPGRPDWWRVRLVGADVTSAKGYSKDAKSFTVEKADDVKFGDDDTTRPSGPDRK